MVDEAMRRRVARWPIVGVVHTLLSPVLAFFRINFARKPEAVLVGAEGLADAYLNGDGVGVAARVQTTFAQLQQSHAIVSSLYRRRKLWEPMAAEQSAGELRRRVADTIERQRGAVRARPGGSNHRAAAYWRGLLTIGAIVWFPLVQPLLEAMLNPGRTTGGTLHDFAYVLVQVLGGAYLLKNATFLLVYFVVLWAVIRWDTQRRVTRLMARWRAGDAPDPILNPTAQAAEWMDGLLAEVRAARERMRRLIAGSDSLRKQLEAGQQPVAGAA
jgi:hypothetical protein